MCCKRKKSHGGGGGGRSLLFGMLVGMVLGLLLAPRPGSEILSTLLGDRGRLKDNLIRKLPV